MLSTRAGEVPRKRTGIPNEDRSPISAHAHGQSIRNALKPGQPFLEWLHRVDPTSAQLNWKTSHASRRFTSCQRSSRTMMAKHSRLPELETLPRADGEAKKQALQNTLDD